MTWIQNGPKDAVDSRAQTANVRHTFVPTDKQICRNKICGIKGLIVTLSMYFMSVIGNYNPFALLLYTIAIWEKQSLQE